MRRTPFAAAAWVWLIAGPLLSACRPSAQPLGSGVRGHVPVGHACPDPPYPAGLDVINPVGRLPARLQADDRCEFALGPAQSTYPLLVSAAEDALLANAGPVEIVSQPGRWTEISVRMDSGIG